MKHVFGIIALALVFSTAHVHAGEDCDKADAKTAMEAESKRLPMSSKDEVDELEQVLQSAYDSDPKLFANTSSDE